MTLVKRVTADWYEVMKSNGQKGLVPSNYIEEFDPDASDKMVRAIAEYIGRGGQVSFVRGEAMTLLRKASADWFEVKKANGDRGLAPSSYVEECTLVFTAIADYHAPPGQISLAKGEDVVLLRRKSVDWCDVRRANGQTGLAPISYLQQKDEVLPPTWRPPPLATAVTGAFSNARNSVLEAPVVIGSFGALPSAEERARVPPERWTESHVISWLRDQAPPAPQYMDSFRRNDINGVTLLSLSEADLESIGVSSLRARRQIYQAIQTLKQSSGAGGHNAFGLPSTSSSMCWVQSLKGY